MIVENCTFNNVYEVHPNNPEKLRAVIKWRVAQLMVHAGITGEFGMVTQKVDSIGTNQLVNLQDPNDSSKFLYPEVSVLGETKISVSKINRFLKQQWLPKINDEIGKRGVDTLYADFVKNAMEVQNDQPKEEPKPKAKSTPVQESWIQSLFNWLMAPFFWLFG